MSVTSRRTVSISFTGDLIGEEFPFGAVNTSSPVRIETMDLTSGDGNSLTIPTGAVGLTIVPPVSNMNLITLKGDASDAGIAIHLTHPTSLGLGSLATIILNAAEDIAGVRLIWS